jgi:hypothetical protein
MYRRTTPAFADLTSAEFAAFVSQQPVLPTTLPAVLWEPATEAPPTPVDWRAKGDVCAVSDQGSMGGSPLVNSSVSSCS